LRSHRGILKHLTHARTIDARRSVPSTDFRASRLSTYGGDLAVDVYNLRADWCDDYHRRSHRNPNSHSNPNSNSNSHPNGGASRNASIAHRRQGASDDRVSRCDERSLLGHFFTNEEAANAGKRDERNA
jgi:hypothetical protein